MQQTETRNMFQEVLEGLVYLKSNRPTQNNQEKTINMKNLVAYKLGEAFNLDALVACDFEKYGFIPCGKMDSVRTGFVPNPFGELFTVLPDAVVVTLAKQEKKPKAAHVKHLVQQKRERMFELEGRYPGKAESELLKEEAYQEILPVTFPDAAVNTQVIFHNDGHAYLDTTYKKAEDVLSFIREAIGSLPAVPLSSTVEDNRVSNKLNTFILNEAPDPFMLGDKAKIVDQQGLKNAITGGSIYASEAKHLITHGGGMTVELGLAYDGSVDGFVLKSDLEISGIKFDKSFLSEGEDDAAGSFMMQYRELVKMFTQLKTYLEV